LPRDAGVATPVDEGASLQDGAHVVIRVVGEPLAAVSHPASAVALGDLIRRGQVVVHQRVAQRLPVTLALNVALQV